MEVGVGSVYGTVALPCWGSYDSPYRAACGSINPRVFDMSPPLLDWPRRSDHTVLYRLTGVSSCPLSIYVCTPHLPRCVRRNWLAAIHILHTPPPPASPSPPRAPAR